MKLCVFYSDSMWASWSLTDGLLETLRRMGHEVTAAPVPASQRPTVSEFARSQNLTTEFLNSHDAIIVCGPEHCGRWMTFLEERGVVDWKKVNVPRLGWLHESMKRDDYSINIENLRPLVDTFFFPNPDDAEEHKGEWLPIGVDTHMFAARPYWNPTDTYPHKKYDVAFIGLMYEKRQKFLASLKPFLKTEGVKLTCGNVQMQDLGGVRMREQTELLAQNYRQTKILLNLPSLSEVLVMKVLEAAACGTCVFTNEVKATMDSFASGVIFYKNGEPENLAKKLGQYMKDDEAREEVAREGCTAVHEKHRLDQRLEQLLGKVTSGEGLHTGQPVLATL